MQAEPRELEQRTENVERRVDRIEAILPTLATKDDLRGTEQRLRTKIHTERRLHETRNSACGLRSRTRSSACGPRSRKWSSACAPTSTS